MNTLKYSSNHSLRIIMAIGAKDMMDALKNRATLANIVVVFLIVVAYRWLPSLTGGGNDSLVVLDTGDSRLMAELDSSSELDAIRVTSMDAFTRLLDDIDVMALGLVIPDTFDQHLLAGQVATVDGYVMWPERDKIQQLKTTWQSELSSLVGGPVSIEIAGILHPSPDSMGPGLAALTAVLGIYFMGNLLIPHLMFEERQTKTIEAMLLSPAGPVHIVLGKAVAGSLYCLLLIVALLILFGNLVVNWWLAALASLCALIFAVAMGLLAGSFCETKAQIMAWSMIPAQILLIPVFLALMEPILPEFLRAALPWMPMVGQSLLFRYAFSNGASLADVLSALAIVLASGLAVLALVVWKVRRTVH